VRIIVTGSREWENGGVVYAVLWRHLDECVNSRDRLRIVHGGCDTGADAIASDWYATVRMGRSLASAHLLTPEVHRANWTRYGLAAGPIRNETMARAGADLCVGFLKNGAKNKGTEGMLDLARQYGIPTVTHRR
jgi:hypothetical protein